MGGRGPYNIIHITRAYFVFCPAKILITAQLIRSRERRSSISVPSFHHDRTYSRESFTDGAYDTACVGIGPGMDGGRDKSSLLHLLREGGTFRCVRDGLGLAASFALIDDNMPLFSFDTCLLFWREVTFGALFFLPF